MARDKLITIRIESEKREAFKELAKSQNTDTASLLYDFISGCLDGKIDIGIVTGKKQWIDKIDNQIGSDRIDKLETDTQRIDHWIGALSERVNDWILRSDRRVNDCEKELSEKMVSLEHRLNALASQLDSQQDSQQIDSIDTDSQKDRQGENPDIETVATVESVDDTVESVDDTVESVDDTVESVDDSVESVDTVETVDDTVEAVDKVESVYEPVTDANGPVPGDSIEPGKGEGMNPNQAHEYLISKGIEDISYYYLNKWAKDKEGLIPWRGKNARKHLTLKDGLYFPTTD